jgi:hypothetical protein
MKKYSTGSVRQLAAEINARSRTPDTAEVIARKTIKSMLPTPNLKGRHMYLNDIIERMDQDYYDCADHNHEGIWAHRVQHIADNYLVDWPYEFLADDGIRVEPGVLDAIRWMIAAGMVKAYDGGVAMVHELMKPLDPGELALALERPFEPFARGNGQRLVAADELG